MEPQKKKWLIIGGFSLIGIAAIAIKSGIKIHSPIPFVATITQQFSSAHNGIDFAVPIGTSIIAPASGIVEKVYYNELGGYQIILSHPGKNLFTGFAHLSEQLVSAGQKVQQGQTIAKSGNTGYSTGPHLHFTVLNKNGIAIDPLKVIK